MKVIKLSNISTKLPFFQTIVYLHLLHYYNAPEWVWGTMIFSFAIIWVVYLYAFVFEEKVDIFEEIEKKKGGD